MKKDRGAEAIRCLSVASSPGSDRFEATLYLPGEEKPTGALVWVHGGGWIGGSVAEDDPVLRRLCTHCRLAVLAVDYSLSPRVRFPVALQQCLAAVRWAEQHDAAYGWPADRLLIGGESAGGSIAAGVALRLRDIGGTRLCGQLLVCPALTSITDRERFPSASEYAEGFENDTVMRQTHWDAYTDHGLHGTNIYVTPLSARSLADLPSTIIVTAECDPIRDEAEDYARLLTEAGVPCRTRRCDGLLHGAGFGDPALFAEPGGAFRFVSDGLRTLVGDGR